MKTIIAMVVVLGVAAGGAYYWKMGAANGSATATDVSTAAVTRGPISLSVACTGRVVSNLDVDIKCKASGAVQKLPLDVSDVVKKGDLLLELDPIDENRAVSKATADVAQWQAKLDQAKQNVLVAESELNTAREKSKADLTSVQAKMKDLQARAERRKKLLEQGFGTQEDFDMADALATQAMADVQNAQVAVMDLKTKELGLESKRQDVKLAEAQLQSYTISLSDAKQRLADTRVVAPMDGVVSARNVQIGTIISSAISNVGGGTTVMVLSDLSHIYVLGAVDESDVGRVELGQKVILTADAFKGMRFRGKVVRIATRGVNTSNVITFEVKIEVTGENKNLLKPEMTSNVEIVLDRKDDALMVPTGAVTRSKEGKFTVTLPGKDGAAGEEREVEVGLNDGTNWEITKGLNEGDVVVVKRQEADSRWRSDSMRRMGAGMMMGPPRSGGGGRH